MQLLNYTEMATLRRRYGLVVTRQDSLVHCLDRDGNRRIHSVEFLRELARPSLLARLCNWIAGVSV